LKNGLSIGRIAGWLALTGFIAMPLSWIPLFIIGPTVLEIPNAVSIAFLLLLPFAILVSKRMIHIHLVFGLLLLWSLLYFAAQQLHGTLNDGRQVLQQQFMEAAFGWMLALTIAHSNLRLHQIGLWALVSLLGFIELSALLVRVDLFTGLIDYLITQNRGAMLYGVMRPSFNAFVQTSTDLSYVGAVINSLASSLVLLSLLIFMREGEADKGSSLLAKGISIFGLIFASILFSSSAMLVILAFACAYLLEIMRRGGPTARVLVPVTGIAVVILLAIPAGTFIMENIAEDTASRSSRLDQYIYALNAISSHAMLGIGFFLIDNNPVHNWPLFSWSTSGLFAFLTVISVYLLLTLSGLRAARYLRKGAPVIFGLWAIVIVRTSFGGGGGVPTGAAIGAMAALLGLLERHRRFARAARRPSPPEGYPSSLEGPAPDPAGGPANWQDTMRDARLPYRSANTRNARMAANHQLIPVDRSAANRPVSYTQFTTALPAAFKDPLPGPGRGRREEIGVRGHEDPPPEGHARPARDRTGRFPGGKCRTQAKEYTRFEPASIWQKNL
jgi:hypothetical protein